MRIQATLVVLALSLGACREAGNAELAACADASDPAAVVAACSTAVESGKLAGGPLGAAHMQRAIAYSGLGQSDRALADMDVALTLMPDRQAEIRNYRGIVHGQKGDLAAALADFDAALARDPKFVDASINRGKALSDSGKFARSVAEFDRALELDPTNPFALNGRCWSRAVLGVELEKAFADCNAAVEAGDVDLANNLNSRGFVHYRRGEYREAIASYGESLEHGDLASSYYVRGLARRALGEDGADADIERALALEPGVRERYATYGVTVSE